MSNKSKKIERFFGILPSKGRLKFFLFFVLLSFTFWISTKLSNTYTLDQSFLINWINVPEGIVMHSNNKQIKASITANGIDILIYRLFNKPLDISLEEARFDSKIGEINIENQQFLIQNQFFGNTKLNFIIPTSLYFDFSILDAKVVAVVPNVQINLRAGYLSDTPIKIVPDSILVRGPKSILDTLGSIRSKYIKLDDVYESISKKISLKLIPEIQLSELSTNINLSVSRYSEKEFTLAIGLINIPKGIRVKLFPPKAKIRVTLPLSVLRTIDASDFNLVVDYNDIIKKESEKLELIMIEQPPSIKKIIFDPERVNYLIRK
tara:strand:+ start:156 stop:1118 length:963 start_codon:yes stop_codon:yes gene_type:complete